MGSGIARTFAGDRCLDDVLTRWARRARIGLATSVAAVTAAGLVLQQCGPTHRPNGERLAIEDVRLHIDCAGEPSGLATFVAMQRDLTRLSTHSRHFVVPEADHVSLLTRRGHAQLVASKIRELYPELRLADR